MSCYRPGSLILQHKVLIFTFNISSYSLHFRFHSCFDRRRGHAHIFSDENPLEAIRTLIFDVSLQYLFGIVPISFWYRSNFPSVAEATTFRHKVNNALHQEHFIDENIQKAEMIIDLSIIIYHLHVSYLYVIFQILVFILENIFGTLYRKQMMILSNA